MVLIDLDDFDAPEEESETIAQTRQTKNIQQQTIFDMDDASYPSSSPGVEDVNGTAADNNRNTFTMSRVDLDESVVVSVSSDEAGGVEDDSRESATPRKTTTDRKQQGQVGEERLRASDARRLFIIVASFVLLVCAFAIFLVWWRNHQSKSDTSTTTTRTVNDCQLCPDGYALSTPDFVFDLPTSPASVKGLTCAQVWEKAQRGEYNARLFCALIRAEASQVCECSKVLPKVDTGTKVTGPTASPVSAPPTTSPTEAPFYVPPNPVPDNRARSYFNYDITDRKFGPNNWSRIDMTGTYFREFGEDGFGTWDGHLQYHVADSTMNRCGHTGKQSPVNIIETTWGESKCTAAHQIRTRPGSLTLTNEDIEKQILPNALRILLNRRRCLDFDRNCFPRPPIADFPNYSSTVTHFSDLLHLDIKVPGEHHIKGETFDAEIQMMHIHLDDSRIAYIGVPIRATTDGYNEKYQSLLDQFQIVYNEHQAECATKQRRGLRNTRGFLDLGNTKQSSYSDDPDLKRRLQQQARTLFDPHSDFLETVYFYRYNGSSPDPPCFPVTWFFLNKPINIDFQQLRQTKQLLFTHVNGDCQKTSVHNEDQSVARPIQPLGIVQGTNEKREIMSCMDGSFPPDPQ